MFILMLAATSGIVVSQLSNFSVHASESSPYNTGYNHGCDDAGISDPDDRYINQAEKGPGVSQKV
jgi:hypothetical protein